MTSVEITRALVCRIFNYRRNVVVPNSYFLHGGRFEADLLILRPSNWLEEVEIKVSVADFRRDFTAKADKHRRLIHGCPVQRNCPSWRSDQAGYEAENPLHVPFSYFGSTGAGVAAFWDYTDPKPGLLRRFWFAMPEEVYERVATEIPEYCGVIACGTGHYRAVDPKIVRAAPPLKPARKVTEKERSDLLHDTYQRYWSLAVKSMQSEVFLG